MEIKSGKLKGERIALCVTGSIAAIEAPKIARELLRHSADVTAYMSEDAKKIIHPNAMEFATEKGVVTKLTGKLEHIADYDLILIAPATANTISKIAWGVADTAITALALTSRAKVLIAPAMDEGMYSNPILRDNIEKLKGRDFIFVGPSIREGKAKLAGLEDIVDLVIHELHKKDLEGLNVLVTAGPTIEYLDPIRVITNKSSGKMGIEIAKEAFFRGANVKLIYGFGTERVPPYLDVTNVETGREMLEAVQSEISNCDIFVSAAAVSDFTIEAKKEKIESRRGGIDVRLLPTPKILDSVEGYEALKVGFKALHNVSKESLVDSAYDLLKEHDLDLVVANDVSKSTFRSDESEVFIVDEKKGVVHIPLTSKMEISEKLWNMIAEMRSRG